MTDTTIESGSKVAAGYAAMVADFVAASAVLKHDKARYAPTLAAAYGAFAAGYVAAAAAADQAGAVTPFPLLPLPDTPAAGSPLDVLTLSQAAEYLQLPEDAVRAVAEAGRLVGQNVGGEWRFVRDSILTWLRTPRQPAPNSRITPPVVQETPEEHEAFLASIQAYRDEIDRATGHGKYAPE
jgi:excisionase family DNA binding protein